MAALLLVLAVPSAVAAKRRSATTRPVTTQPAPPMAGFVPYGASESQWMNIYPSAVPGSPTVVFVHGGGWRLQGYNLSRWELESKAMQAEGFSVFEIAYRQDTRETPAFPMEPEDVEAATRWVYAHAASYNGSPAKLVLVGGSAGGQLAAVAAEQLSATSPGIVKGVVTLSAPFNFVTLAPQLEANTYTNDGFTTSVHRALGWAEGTPFPQAFAEQWSPALHAPAANCPAWLIYNSENEFIPLSQAREMYANLTHAGCQARLVVVPGEEHAFLYWHRYKETTFAFIREP